MIQTNSNQDIDSVTLAAGIVKVMNAKIVAKINQEGSDIHCNTCRLDYYLRPDTVRPTDPILQSEPFVRLSCEGSRRM